MSGPTEFSLESVRQFMLAKEGKVTNHELVKHFKAWLTNPTEKESARQKFKEYVNTLASIKQENGEKYLVLKRRFYPNFEDPPPRSVSPSLLDEVMAGYQAISRQSSSSDVPPDLGLPIVSRPSSYYSPTQSQRSSFSHTPPLYRTLSNGSNGGNGPPPTYRSPPPPPPSSNLLHEVGLPIVPSDFSASSYKQPPEETPPPLPKRTTNGYDKEVHSKPPPLPPSHPPGKMKGGNIPIIKEPPTSLPLLNNELTSPSEEDKTTPDEMISSSSSSSSSLSVDSESIRYRRSLADDDDHNKENSFPRSEKNEKISVKERTKTFNRMASEVELTAMKQQSVSLSGSAVKRRNSRAGADRRVSAVKDDDTSSISTLDQNVKQWMIKASQGDYHALVKMLLDDDRLAKHKDFTSGYTALHWACKYGNLDMVKLLCGNYKVDVNSKSHGGYTPLHLSCQFGNQEVFDFLVKAYGADPNIRDNSGKKPRQCMVATDQTSSLSLSSATFKQLKDRRRNRRQASEKNAGILRFGSLSVKVKKTTEAFNNYFHNHDKKNSDPDKEKMPPPKFAPIKKRKSKRSVDFGKVKSAPVTPTIDHISMKDVVEEEEENDSDSEYGFDSGWSNA
ncbi:uncharacterized protein sowah [Lepeophtheirus salmonis]|uniref:SOWAHA-C winged helix-turn-helix domain-containing protein n=1 Tax=Lepeophtheirus salmonis TaxID=72036 RepID=A0A0K2VEV9_LEPSM|nr:ankyrin repeat domain-containing protein SOWAHB-like [Lepeophtheirus salmonis]